MSHYRHPDPAVRREMRQIERDRKTRPSHLMDYGPDWPPKPKPAPQPVAWRALGRNCLNAVILFTAIWLIAAYAVHVREHTLNLRLPADHGVSTTHMPGGTP